MYSALRARLIGLLFGGILLAGVLVNRAVGSYPDGQQNFTGYIINGSQATSPDGFFVLTNSLGLPQAADNDGAFINSTSTGQSGYIRIYATGGLGRFRLSSINVGEYWGSGENTNFSNVYVEGRYQSTVRGTSNVVNSADGGNVATYPLDISSFAGENIDEFRIYFTAAGDTPLTAFNLVSFSIADASAAAPTVTTTAASGIGTTSATLGGNVTADGGATVTARGVVWSASDSTPTIGEAGVTQVGIGSGTGTFSQSVTGLPVGSTVYFAAYATNAEGTSYGSVLQFNTVGPNSPPTLTATGGTPTFTEDGTPVQLFSDVSISTVESGQTITSLTFTVTNVVDGSSEIATTSGTDITLAHGNSGSIPGIGSFSVSLTGSTATVNLSGLSRNGSQMATLVESITYRNTSQSPSTLNRVVTLTRLTDSGGTDHGGNDTTNLSVSATVTVVAVNDAPTLSGGPYILTGTDEDTTSSGTLVSTILAGLTHGDVDSGASSGVAITASTGNGTWQYSTDGATWNGVGSVSGNAAILLSSSTQLRYAPDGANGETATLTFRAWDQTSGTASTNATRNTADTTTNGGTTAFSSGTAQASISVSSVNDAPVLTPASPALAGIDEDDTNNNGQTIASIIGSSISDVDTGAISGIAVTALTSGNGTWEYSLDGGTSWSSIGSVSASSALLLRSSDRIRFVPNAVSGTSASVTYRAWDQTGSTAGQQGTKVNASSTGGSTPFSTSSDTATITVSSVNDLPVVTTSGGSASFIEGNNVTSTPVAIDPGLTVADVDHSTLASGTVSITGNFQSGQDVLTFTNNGSTMGNISASYNSGTGVLTLTSAGATATLAEWQAALRAVTYTNSSEAPATATRTVTFTVHDGTDSSIGSTRTITVTSVNDAPIVTAPASLTVTEDVAHNLTGFSFADADAGSASVTVTFSVTAGTLSATSGGGVTASGSGTSTLTLVGSVADLNAFIAAANVAFLTATNSTADVTLTTAINDGGNTGSGGAQTDSATTTLQVDSVNDAPTITAPGSIVVTEDVASPLTGLSFADVDAGSASVTVTLSVGSGTLAASSGAGVTVGGSGTSTLTLAGSIADLNAFIAASSISFTTATNATSSVVLTVLINDGGNTGSGGAQTATTTVTLTVTAVNDAPVNVVPSAQATPQDSPLVFSVANSNAISISDVDAGSNPVRVTLTATHGSISLVQTTGLSFVTGDGLADTTMTFEGTITHINAALEGLVFQPSPAYNGPAALQITTNDLGNTGTGGALTDVDTIDIEVLIINPVVTSVGATSVDGAYKIGDTLTLVVTFDQIVTVDTTGGTPSLLLETGATDRTATYTSGSGTSTLTFTYLVQAGDASPDLDYATTSALSFNGATIRNATNDDAILTLPTVGGPESIAGQHALVIDGIAPVITSGSSASATFGQAFSGYTITAIDTTTVSYAATGLPPGLSANASTGEIAGTPTAAGTYAATISATDAVGNPSTAPLTFLVEQATATVTVGGLSQTYDGSPKAATATTNPSGLTVTFTYAGSATIPTAAGTYAVVAVIDDANYQGSSSGTLQIAQATQTVSFPSVGSVTIGQPVALSATASSGLPVTFSLVSGPASLAGSTLTINESSVVVVRAIQDGDNNYLPATTDLTIEKASKLAQTITFAPLSNQPATAAPFGLTATASSGLPVTFAVVDGPAMLSGAKLSLTAVPGTVTVRASQAGDTTYLPAPDVTHSFSVTAVGPLVYFGTLGHGVTARQIAAQLKPDGKSGTMIGIIPGTSEAFVVDFAPGPFGDWTATVTTISGGSSSSASSAASLALDTAERSARFSGGKTASLSTFTRTFRGVVSGDVLTGTIDELGLTFTTSLQPPVGPTADLAGYYEAPSLNSATGSTHAIVGTQGQVYVLIITASAIIGNGGSVAAGGAFAVPAADGISVTGSVSATSTSINGQINLPSGAIETFSGVRESTLRTDRMINLSTRAQIAASGGAGNLITGFVIGGNSTKKVLLRGVGPSLGALGVTSPLADPQLRVFNGKGELVAHNDNWGGTTALTQAMQRIGAFALPANSKDAALLLDLTPGAYTVHVLNGGQAGVALAEIYDASENPNGEYQRLINISSRGHVGTGEGQLIGGFVVTGNAPKRVLVRGSGPALAKFGLQQALTDPQIQLFDRAGSLVAANNDWGTPAPVAAGQTVASAAEIAAAGIQTGAFELPAGSKDAALIVTLAPGTYTVHLSGVNQTTGIGLIEIYETP
jgi:hypothetical protein